MNTMLKLMPRILVVMKLKYAKIAKHPWAADCHRAFLTHPLRGTP